MEQIERERLEICWKNYSFGGWWNMAEAPILIIGRIVCSE